MFKISTFQFGLILASYAVSAGLAGLIGCFVLDRFDRKTAMLWLYSGFAAGTWLCAISTTYHQLVAARFVAGAFGGVVGAVILAIIGDVVPMERRGAAMGMVMSSFSVASIIGVPLGIELSTRYNWHIPFHAIAALSVIIIAIAAVVTPPLRGHMKHTKDEHPVARTWAVMVHPDHQKAFLFMAIITCAGFLVFPFVATYMTNNVGFTKNELKWIYLCGGLCTIFSMNWVGVWSDRSGKMRVFKLVSLSTAVPLLLVTNLPRVPLVVALAVTTLLFVCMSARMVPAMAMMTAVVESRYRGGFMSINSAVQQLSMGVASLASGLILTERPDHQLTHFPINGVLAIACAYSCIYLARFLKPAPESKTADVPVLLETV